MARNPSARPQAHHPRSQRPWFVGGMKAVFAEADGATARVWALWAQRFGRKFPRF